ncbi:type II secretion system F family protein [Idiomarina seosinensis]|uniref:type II secretion system F family protein n=1 Tax=Idiomarina seosinensis TaxID=281739 RepID=UPI003850BB4A
MRRNYWSAARQWQWVEDYCHWLEDGCSPLLAAKAMQLSAAEYGLQREQQLACQLHDCLRHGQPLLTGLQGYLQQDLLQLFALGQQNHCLMALLKQYQQFQHQRRLLVMKLWRQRLYPLFVLAMVLVTLTLAGTLYLPKLLQHSATNLPHWSVDAVLVIAAGLQRWGLVLALLLFLLVLAYRWLGRVWTSPLRFTLERWGLFGSQRAVTAVWVTQMVALLLRNRLSLQSALKRLQPLSSAYARYHLQQMQCNLARGEQQLAAVMTTGLLTPQILFRLRNSGRQQALVEGLWRTALRSSASIERSLLMRQRLLLTGIYALIIGLIALLVQASGQVMMSVLMH